MMGAVEDAKKVSSVLIYNFPDSIWTKKLPIILANENSLSQVIDLEDDKEQKFSFFSLLKSIFNND